MEIKRDIRKYNSLLGSLALIDLLGTLSGFLLAYWIRIYSGLISYHQEAVFADYLKLYWFSIPLLILIFRNIRLYDHHELFCGTQEYVQIGKGCTFYVLGIIIISYSIHSTPPSRVWLLGTWLFSIISISAGRFAFRQIIKKICTHGRPLEKALIIGANEEAKALAKRLEGTGMVEVIGFLDEFSPVGEKIWNDKMILGPPYKFCRLCKRKGISLVVLTQEATSWETQREVLRKGASLPDIDIQISPGFSELYLASMRVSFKGNVPLLRFQPGYVTGLDSAMKMMMDYALGTIFLIISWPFILMFGLILQFQGSRPVIEGFDVAGKNNRPFRMYKFRTGTGTATSYRSFRTRIKPDSISEKAGSMGLFLFRTGLDKLPQLFNVMMGQMSLVGPRVVPLNTRKQYGPWLPGILAVKPGISGSWALKKSGDLEQEISLTYYDVSNWSIGEDFSILGQTLMRMIQTRFKARHVKADDLTEENTGMRKTWLIDREKKSSMPNRKSKVSNIRASWFRGWPSPKRVYLNYVFSLIGIKTIFDHIFHFVTRIDIH